MTPLTIREIETIRSEYEPDREATPRERSLLAKHGTPVRLPIDDAVTPATPLSLAPTQPPAPPRPRPVIRPAALGPKVDNGRVNLTTPAEPPTILPGMLTRTVQIPRPRNARLEAAAEPVYEILSHETRVLLRVLDQACASVPAMTICWAAPWQSIVQAFKVDDAEEWEAVAAAHKAVDEISELQIACIIPGHVQGSGTRPISVLFLSEHTHRQMLRSAVLNDPNAVFFTLPGYDVLALARKSLVAA